MKEPISTISNLFYVIAGVIGWAIDHSIGGDYFLWSFTLLAGGSMWYHGTLSKRGQAADEIGMYTSFGTLTAVLAGRAMGVEVPIWLPIGILAFAVVMWRHLDSFIVMPSLVAMSGALAWISTPWMSACGIMTFAAAVLIRQTGEHVVLQGDGDILHSLWHLLTAAGALMLFLS